MARIFGNRKKACFEVLRGGSDVAERGVAGGAIVDAPRPPRATASENTETLPLAQVRPQEPSGPRPTRADVVGQGRSACRSRRYRPDALRRAMIEVEAGDHPDLARSGPVSPSEHHDPSARTAIHPRDPPHCRLLLRPSSCGAETLARVYAAAQQSVSGIPGRKLDKTPMPNRPSARAARSSTCPAPTPGRWRRRERSRPTR